MIAIGMKNRYVKTSPIENNGLQDSEAVGEGNKPWLLPSTVKIGLSGCKILKRSIIITLENKFEYDQIKELLDSIMYQKKLMNCYGLDTVNCNWDLKKFPVTRTDTQMNGIQRDIQKYNETVCQYNDYSKRLGLEYGIDIVNEMKKGCNIIFRPPSNS